MMKKKGMPARGLDLYTSDDPWRILRIMSDFVDAFDMMSELGMAVTIFGSARTSPKHPAYKNAVKIGKLLAESGLTVITGGGGGIMEAANKGASEAKGVSAGLNISLPFEQNVNPYVNFPVPFHYFFARKVCFAKYSTAFVFMPGGFGTLDEMSELMTLVQTQKIPLMPLIFFGSEFWNPFLDWVKETLLGEKYISPEDLNQFHVVDKPEEVLAIVQDHIRRAKPAPTTHKF